MRNKKQLILMVLNELDVNSDEKHPITQTKIAENLSGEKYTCDRKTVGRNIEFLVEMGYPIEKTNKGFYMKKMLSVEDVSFVKQAILLAEGKSASEKERLSRITEQVLMKWYRR